MDIGPRLEKFTIRTTLLVGIFGCIIGPLLLAVYATETKPSGEKKHAPTYLYAGIVVTLVGVAYVAGGTRSVSVHERGLRLAKGFTTRDIPWTDVTKVSVGKRTASGIERAVSTGALLAPNKVAISVVGRGGPLIDFDSHHVAKNVLRVMGEAIVQHGGLVPTRTTDPNVFSGERAV